MSSHSTCWVLLWKPKKNMIEQLDRTKNSCRNYITIWYTMWLCVVWLLPRRLRMSTKWWWLGERGILGVNKSKHMQQRNAANHTRLVVFHLLHWWFATQPMPLIFLTSTLRFNAFLHPPQKKSVSFWIYGTEQCVDFVVEVLGWVLILIWLPSSFKYNKREKKNTCFWFVCCWEGPSLSHYERFDLIWFR